MKLLLVTFLSSFLFLCPNNSNAFSKSWACTDTVNSNKTFQFTCSPSGLPHLKGLCYQSIFFDANSNYVATNYDMATKLQSGQKYIEIDIEQDTDFKNNLLNTATVRGRYSIFRTKTLNEKYTLEQSKKVLDYLKMKPVGESSFLQLYKIENGQITVIPEFETLFIFHLGVEDNLQTIQLSAPEIIINNGCDTANFSRQAECKKFGFKSSKYVCKSM